MPSETDWAYLAGLFDGEGYLLINSWGKGKKNPQGSWFVECQIQLVDVAPLDWAYDLFGGSLYRRDRRPTRPNEKPIWRWVVRGAVAREVLLGMLPYLRIKDDEARVALRFWDTPVGKPGFPLSSEERMRRATLAEELKQIKHKAEYDA